MSPAPPPQHADLDVEDLGLWCDTNHQSGGWTSRTRRQRRRPRAMAILIHSEIAQVVRISRIWNLAVLGAEVDSIIRREGCVEDQIAGNIGMFGIYTRVQNGNSCPRRRRQTRARVSERRFPHHRVGSGANGLDDCFGSGTRFGSKMGSCSRRIRLFSSIRQKWATTSSGESHCWPLADRLLNYSTCSCERRISVHPGRITRLA